jgi:hypothetical protein
MRHFSVWTFILVTVVHVIASGYLVGEAVGASYAQEHGLPDHSAAWTAALWIWDTLPMMMSSLLRPLRPIHFLYLVVPWSLFVGACFGVMVPRAFTQRRQIV